MCISQPIAKIELKQQSLNQIRHCLINKFFFFFFDQEILKYFNNFQNQNFSIFSLCLGRTVRVLQFVRSAKFMHAM